MYLEKKDVMFLICQTQEIQLSIYKALYDFILSPETFNLDNYNFNTLNKSFVNGVINTIESKNKRSIANKNNIKKRWEKPREEIRETPVIAPVEIVNKPIILSLKNLEIESLDDLPTDDEIEPFDYLSNDLKLVTSGIILRELDLEAQCWLQNLFILASYRDKKLLSNLKKYNYKGVGSLEDCKNIFIIKE